jgi:hypothetical protein
MRIILLGLIVFAAGAGAAALDGVWRSEGYGLIYEISGRQLKTFEITAATCVTGLTATLQQGELAGRDATFRSKGGDVLFIRSGGGPDHKLLHNEGAASDVRIERLPARPKVCDTPTGDTPENNFEVFTRTWSENYISFELKGTDWDKAVSGNRSEATTRTTPAKLFDIFTGMIRPFGDAHTFLAAPKLKRQFSGIRPGTDRATKAHKIQQLFAATNRGYLHGPLREFCNGRIAYGHIDETTGYLWILAFAGYTKGGDYAAGAAALEAALDTIFSDPHLKALVIDVRINHGGADPYGLEIASRLANGDYLAYTKVARASPGADGKWTPGDESRVRPSSRPGFRGPVVELIGPLTISAGETFTQALMGRTPHVTRIGENTQGVFSDVLERLLPNGWRFGLPNEVYWTPQGRAFDGEGIPPDIEVPVFAEDDLKAGRDPGMAKALEILSAGKPITRTPGR